MIFLLVIIGIIALLVALAPSILAAMFFWDATEHMDSARQERKQRQRDAQRAEERHNELMERLDESETHIYVDNRSMHFHNHPDDDYIDGEYLDDDY